MAAAITTAASALLGRSFSRLGANTRRSATATAPTTPVSCVFAPAASQRLIPTGKRSGLRTRAFSNEYGRREIVPQVEQERKPTFVKVVLNTNGKTLEEITNFPIVDDLALRAQNEAKPLADADNAHAPQRVPVVGIGGKVIRWCDATDEQDADPEELP